MIMISFITKHLVQKIEDLTIHMRYDEYYYFEETIANGKFEEIDRINRFSVYQKGKYTPHTLYHLTCEALAELYVKLKNDQGFIQKAQRPY